MASVSIRAVRKAFGSTQVLHGVSIEIADGEFTVLVGPSGCGKSTLLRMIAGLEEINDGEIAIGGRVVNRVPPKQRDIAMVFQNYALYPHMTVRDNMAFSLQLASAPKSAIDERVGRAAAILGLSGLLDRYPRQLSGGQRQRVAMGRAIVRDPQVFLFDEPLSNLDAKLRVQTRAELKDLHQRLRTTTVYVTHDQIEAMTMADKIVVMNGGRIEQIGSPLELYDLPANHFVAGFIGSPAMNFFPGTIEQGGFRADDGSLWPLPASRGQRQWPSRAVRGAAGALAARARRWIRGAAHGAGGRADRLRDPGARQARRAAGAGRVPRAGLGAAGRPDRGDGRPRSGASVRPRHRRAPGRLTAAKAGSMSEDSGSILAKTARGAGWVVAWRMMTRALGLLSTLVLVRLLAPADFGLIALASSFSVSIEAFSWIGIEEGVIRHKAPTPALLDTAFTLSILRGAAVFAVIAAAAYPAARFFGDPRLLWVLIALGGTAFIETFINVGTIEFRRDFSFHREFQLYLLPRIVSILIAIGSASLLRTYWALVAGIVSNQALRVLFSYTMHPYRPRLRLSAWREMASYSAWNSVIAGAGALRDRVDTIMIGRAMSPASVGFYAVGYEIAGLPVTELIAPLTRAAFAGFAAAWREEVASGETWLRLVSAMALLTFPAGVGMSAVAQPLIGLAFGPGWEQSVPIVQMLGIALCLTVFGMVGQTLFLAQGHMRTSLAITVGATALRVLLLLALIPRFGLSGAAAAAASGLAVENVLSGLWAMRRLHLSPVRDLLPQIWRCVLATAVMAAALWGAGLGWREVSLPLLAAAVGLGAVVYGAVLVLLWIACGRPSGPETDLWTLAARGRHKRV